MPAVSVLRFLPLFLTLLLWSLPGTCVRAQEAEVSGKVTDPAGEPLVGATVQVIGSVIGTTTDLEGHYDIEVPPGRIRLLYSYLGYENYDTVLTVGVAERERSVDVEMSESFLETGEVIVRGRRAAGQAQALRVQQSSQLNQTIIHAETFNKYPDITIAESVARMPGVSILRGVDEGEVVQLRGLPEQYTAVNLNGQRLPTIQPEVDQGGSLDIIQSNLVNEVRIVRARSADMDGDAIAGAVDFRIRQPEEKLELLLQAGQGMNFGFDGNPDQFGGVTQLSGVFNSELADEKVYALGAASYLRNGRGTRTQRYEYGDVGERGRNLYSSRPFDTNRLSERVGLIGAVELRPSIYNRMRLSYNFSELKEENQERQLFVNLGDDPSVRRLASNWTRNRTLKLVALEVENNFPKTRLDYQLSFSETAELLRDRIRQAYRADQTDPAVNDEATLFALDPYGAAAAQPLRLVTTLLDNSRLEETVAIGSLNLTRYLNRKRTSFLKAGARYRSKDRAYGTNNQQEPADPRAPTLPGGTFPELLTQPFAEGINPLDSTNQVYDAKQRIAAGYLMYAANFSSKLSVTAGARYEYVEVEGRNATDTIAFDETYLLPSVNFTYRLRRERQFRLSLYDATSLPNYANYRPLENTPVALIQLDQFSVANPDLRQTRSRNLDLAFERYGRRDGLLSVSLYAKFLNDPTILVQTSRELPSRPVYDNLIVNVDDANVYGFELGFYQSLGFLNQNLRFININGTYNYNIFDVDNPNGLSDDVPLAQAPRQSANLSFVYSNPKRRINLVVAANFRDRVFDRLLDGEPIYRNRLLSVDVSADYEIFKSVSLYLRANNLTDHRFEEWIGESDEEGSLLRQASFYGTWGVVGVRFQPRN